MPLIPGLLQTYITHIPQNTSNPLSLVRLVAPLNMLIVGSLTRGGESGGTSFVQNISPIEEVSSLLRPRGSLFTIWETTTLWIL